MKKWLFAWRYRFGTPRWDTNITPPEVVAAFKEMPRHGKALDLGCGTGTNVIYIARQGWQASGIDFVRQAIRSARRKAKRAGVADATRFYQADVRNLSALALPVCQYALDMGCFHSLGADARAAYISGLAQVLEKDALYMLYAFKERPARGGAIGISEAQVQECFSPAFRVERREEDETAPGIG